MDVITDVRRDRRRVTIVVNGDTEILLTPSLYRERPLKTDEPIDLEEYDNWLLLRQYRPALEKAVGYLALRAHSRHEIEEKLLAAAYRPATVEMVLFKLEKEHLLNDADFARQWVENRAGHKLGKNRIAQELHRKGVPADEAADALEALDEDEQFTAAVSLAEKSLKRAKAGEDSRKTAARIMGQLARRGFGGDMARRAIEQVMADRPEAPSPQRLSNFSEEADETPSDVDEAALLADAVVLVEKGVKRAKVGEDVRKTAQRINAQLARRGFPYDVARQAIRQVLYEEQDD